MVKSPRWTGTNNQPRRAPLPYGSRQADKSSPDSLSASPAGRPPKARRPGPFAQARTKEAWQSRSLSGLRPSGIADAAKRLNGGARRGLPERELKMQQPTSQEQSSFFLLGGVTLARWGRRVVCAADPVGSFVSIVHRAKWVCVLLGAEGQRKSVSTHEEEERSNAAVLGDWRSPSLPCLPGWHFYRLRQGGIHHPSGAGSWGVLCQQHDVLSCPGLSE